MNPNVKRPPGQALALLVGQSLMLAVALLLVIGSCAVLQIAQG